MQVLRINKRRVITGDFIWRFTFYSNFWSQKNYLDPIFWTSNKETFHKNNQFLDMSNDVYLREISMSWYYWFCWDNNGIAKVIPITDNIVLFTTSDTLSPKFRGHFAVTFKCQYCTQLFKMILYPLLLGNTLLVFTVFSQIFLVSFSL